ncbi:glutathione peroxidase [Draconibacterium halophilum]|uniref:Glutathione peroxidase n=1 Tax=Draconibacterium halophilum TaxID=2706887 RepID=A0A6C0RDX7_9BACT|nr:glutathione peroxidase [Draconibacterium halophilum]QIA08868.1 glutathione peroxidase [Draconibacterium halophilum]
MKRLIAFFMIMMFFVFQAAPSYSSETNNDKSELKTFHDFVVKDINGNDFDLAQLKGKKVLVVNTASKCGFTPQFEQLQKLYESLDKEEFEIIGFPANNFLKQDPGSNEEIMEFCTANYGVTFPMMEKVSVCDYIYTTYPPDKNKAEKVSTDEIYQWLTKKELNGVADTTIEWNFQKFLIDENGQLIGSLAPNVMSEIIMLKEWLED